MAVRQPLFVANWKMNFCRAEAVEYLRQFERLFVPSTAGGVDTVLAVPYTLLGVLGEVIADKPGIGLGAQNVHWLDSGAHTGEISAPMLKEHTVSFVIVGHSERRQYYGETDERVSLRTQAALRHGIRPVVCVGDSLEDFDRGNSTAVVLQQLENSLAELTETDAGKITVAYEPVWAIGTGRAATPEIAGAIHKQIRAFLSRRFLSCGLDIPIIYGGSTTPENVTGLLAIPDIDGALPGGSSLKPDTFWALIESGRKAWRPS